jgi:transcriptional regulator with XRE-family HTH domain
MGNNGVLMITRLQIRMARTALGWGVRDLAAKTGLAPGTVSRIEAGKEALGGSLKKIQHALEDAGIRFPAPDVVDASAIAAEEEAEQLEE